VVTVLVLTIITGGLYLGGFGFGGGYAGGLGGSATTDENKNMTKTAAKKARFLLKIMMTE